LTLAPKPCNRDSQLKIAKTRQKNTGGETASPSPFIFMCDFKIGLVVLNKYLIAASFCLHHVFAVNMWYGTQVLKVRVRTLV